MAENREPPSGGGKKDSRSGRKGKPAVVEGLTGKAFGAGILQEYLRAENETVNKLAGEITRLEKALERARSDHAVAYKAVIDLSQAISALGYAPGANQKKSGVVA